MIIDYKGPTIGVVIDANEAASNYVNITFADGYTYEQIKVLFLSNIDEILPYNRVPIGTSIKYPPINSMSPYVLILHLIDKTKSAACGITIEKFGQLPDINYFHNTIAPILITGEDGKKYNAIQSDQFK
jgi:hypothetical protein